MKFAIPAKLKLQVTLRFLASGDSYASLQWFYRIPNCTISNFLPEVLDAIYEELREFLQVPKSQQEWGIIEEGFRTQWNFPNVIGAFDGRHVVVERPPLSNSFLQLQGKFQRSITSTCRPQLLVFRHRRGSVWKSV